MDLILTYHIPNGRGGRHQFKCRNQFSILGRYKLLGDNRMEHRGKLDRDLSLLVWRKNVDNPVNRIGRTKRVQGGEYQVSRFGSSHSNGNGLKIPHLTKQDDVRTLAQGSAQSSKVALGIGADFTLAYDTFLVTVEKFQWILQSDDMLLLCTID